MNQYDQNIIDNQILTKESIRDNLKDLETTKDNPNDIPKRDINLNMDKFVPLNNTPEEIGDNYKSRIPKNNPISNVIGDVNECVVITTQKVLFDSL